MKIGIVGNGVWGKALYSVIIQNNPDVILFGPLDPLIFCDIYVLALPVKAMKSALKPLQGFKEYQIVNTSKGIEYETHKLPFQIVKEVLGEEIPYFSLLGPSFAADVIEKKHTLINIGYKKNEGIEKIKNIFKVDYFHLEPTSNIQALELAAGLKNVYAIICGIAEALNYSMNTKILILMQALKEINRLNDFYHFEFDSTSYPERIGDLLLSCTSHKSRNFTFGTLLVKNTIKDSLEKINSTVEGYKTAESILYLLNEVELPLLRCLKEILESDKPSLINEKLSTSIPLF